MAATSLPEFDLDPSVSPLRTWVIYFHNVDDITVYIGMCRLADIFNPQDVRNNAEWYKLTAGKTVRVIPIYQTDDYAACKVQWVKWVHQYRPRGNLFSQMARRRARVQCVETGAEYDTATEAAHKNGISQSAMSNHLNGRFGYDKIHGMTFRRV